VHLLLPLLLAVTAPRAQDNAPGGYRMSPELPVPSVALRPALVLDHEWANVLQLGFDGQAWLDPWSIHLQAPVVFAWRPDGSWSAAGLGLARIGAARAVSKKPRWLGVELFLPTAPPSMTARSWGTLAQETVFGAGARLSYEQLWPLASPISLRVTAGAHYWSSCQLDLCTTYAPALMPSAEIIAARSWMVAPGWAVVTEHELTIDVVPSTVRIMGRRVQPVGEASMVADLGLQIPLATWADEPTAQLVAQLRWYPQGVIMERSFPEDEEEELEWDPVDPLQWHQ
jgi:hypothetical protein